MVTLYCVDIGRVSWQAGGMARTLRIEYPGAVYQVMNRSDRGDAIFRDAHDYECFLQTLAEACEKAHWQGHANRWSRYSGYLAPPRQRPFWLRVDRLLGEGRKQVSVLNGG